MSQLRIGVLPYFIALSSGAIWGLTFSLARIATEAGRDPLGLSFWQAFGGALVLLVYCAIRRQALPRLHSSFWPVVMIALFGNAIPGSALFYAAPHLPAGLLAILIALVPILTYAGACILLLERFSLRRVAGVAAGFVAAALIIVPESSLPSGISRIWLWLPLLATLAYTIENLYVDRFVADATPLAGTLAYAMLLAAILLLPLVWMLDAFVPISLPLDTVDWAIIAMSVVSSVAYLMYLSLIKLSGAVFASMSGYIVTLSGVGWAMWIFAERHSGWIWLALLLMCAGMALVTPSRTSAKQ